MFKVIAAAIASQAAANSVPVYGQYPGWVVGEGRTGIVVEIYLDLLCSACQGNNPVWNEVLASPWLDGTVADQVYWTYTPFPLPYHTHTFQVTQIVPYLQALCAQDSSNCDLQNQYKDYCYEQLDAVLSESNVSQDDFIAQWTAQVAERFNLDQATLAGLYTYGDSYNANSNVRAMWKYAASKGVSGTPTAFLNGVKLDSEPSTVRAWLNLLQTTYDSQY